MSLLNKEKFGVADFETTKIELTDNQIFLQGGIYTHNKNDEVYLYDSIEEIINFFVKSNTKLFYFHNLGYDFRFMFDYLLNNYDVSIIPYSSNILKVSVYKNNKKLFELRDSFALLRTSLKSANITFNEHYFKSDIGDGVLNYNKKSKSHREYLKLDCLSLYESLSNMKKIYRFDKMYLTIASAFMAEWENRYKNYKKIRIISKYDNFFRTGYYGGRTESYYQKAKNIKGYDFNSLYPSVMAKNKYPLGKIFRTPQKYSMKDLLEHEFFYAKVKNIYIPHSNIPPLAVRQENGGLYFPIGHVKEGIYNSVDIKLLYNMGGFCDLDYGYFWIESDYIFKDIVNYFYDNKLNAKKNGDMGEYERSKRLLNSGYGKFAQKRVLESYIKIKTKKEIFNYIHKGGMIKKTKFKDMYLIKKLSHKNYTTTHISSFITSYARLELYKAILEIKKANKTLYYVDTDSLYTDYNFSNFHPYKLGYLDCEYKNIKEAYFALPKLYAIKIIDNEGNDKIIIKGKGLNLDDLTYEKIKDFVEKHKKINNKRVVISKFKSIIGKYKNSTECYNLDRTVNMNENKRIIGKNYKTLPIELFN